MTLPASGAISLANVNTELGVASNTTRSLNDAAVRSLFGKASGVISMSDGYGKSNAWRATITTHQQQMNLVAWATANGWNGSTAAEITIANGVYIYSDNTAVPALTMGSFPGGLTLIVNGYIMGKGGDGGAVYSDNTGNVISYAPTAGGIALSLSGPITIDATVGYIAGGGGGGGASGTTNSAIVCSGGGGAGGGAGGSITGYNQCPSGGGGGIGSAGGNGTGGGNTYIAGAGGGGGRILPGAGGAGAPAPSGLSVYGYGGYGGGAGGGGGSACINIYGITNGGAGGGGGWGAAGGTGYVCTNAASGATGGAGGSANNIGGNAGLNGGSILQETVGAAGGKAIATNGYGVTWSSGTTHIYGIVG